MVDPRTLPGFAALEYVEMLNAVEAWADATIDEMARERDAWKDTAAQHCRNESFYTGLLDAVAGHLGPDVFVADDGSVMEDPIRLKIAGMVEEAEAGRADLLAIVDEAVALIDSGDGMRCQDPDGEHDLRLVRAILSRFDDG